MQQQNRGRQFKGHFNSPRDLDEGSSAENGQQNTDISKGKLLGLSGWMWQRERQSSVQSILDF